MAKACKRSRKVFVGLDVGSRTCHVVAVDRHGVLLHHTPFATSEAQLRTVFTELSAEVHVHLEASELAGWIRRVLKPLVAEVVISHAKTNAWIAKDPRKSDRVDAFKLAEVLRLGRVHTVYYPDEEHRAEFKQVVQHYDDLTRQQVRLKHKLKARLRQQGLIVRGKSVYSPEGRQAILASIPAPAPRAVLDQLGQLLDHTLEAQAQARQLLRQQAQRYPEIARFQAVPGVGLIGAARFSAYIQTPHRFSSKRKLWRYCRLGITDRSSDGKRRGPKRLDRSGHGGLKDLSRTAFLNAQRTQTDNAIKRAYQQTLARTHDATHARLTTQRKILAILLAMWKGGAEYQDAPR